MTVPPEIVTVDVFGQPAPKGSHRAMLVGGHAVNVPGGSSRNRLAIRAWSSAVAMAAQDAMEGRQLFVGVPLTVTIDFRLVRPVNHYGARGIRQGAPIAPHVKPDLDKLVRCTLDPLEGVVFDGDSRVVEIHACKRYTPPLQAAGARIVIARFAGGKKFFNLRLGTESETAYGPATGRG